MIPEFRAVSEMPEDDMDLDKIPHAGKLVFGSYSDGYMLGPVADASDEYIYHEWWVKVDIATLGQYTGLKDINGRKIFEGDIIMVQATNDDGSTDGMLGRIDYDADIASFGFAVIGGDNWDNHSFDNLFEEGFVDLYVIGNVYENPELLLVQNEESN